MRLAMRRDSSVFLLGQDIGIPGGFGGGFTVTLGLKVVCPSNPYDAKGLLLAAIFDNNPVVFLEHKRLYGAKGGRREKSSMDVTAEVPEEEYEVPLGKLAVRREGSDLTILANML